MHLSSNSTARSSWTMLQLTPSSSCTLSHWSREKKVLVYPYLYPEEPSNFGAILPLMKYVRWDLMWQEKTAPHRRTWLRLQRVWSTDKKVLCRWRHIPLKQWTYLRKHEYRMQWWYAYRLMVSRRPWVCNSRHEGWLFPERVWMSV